MIRGTGAGFRYVPNGVPGIETRLPLLFSGGVMEKRIDLCDFVALTATNPAKLYGLYPRKGSIAIGADADLALWDEKREVTITNDMLHHAVDFTPYEGTVVKGWPVLVLSRGELVCRDGEVVAKAGRGQFLPCASPGVHRPSSADRMIPMNSSNALMVSGTLTISRSVLWRWSLQMTEILRVPAGIGAEKSWVTIGGSRNEAGLFGSLFSSGSGCRTTGRSRATACRRSTDTRSP